MNFTSETMFEEYLISGVLSRRCAAWLLDVLVLMILTGGLWFVLLMFGLATLGLGFGAMGLLPLVPFLYHFISLMSGASATPGQQICGLTVRREADLGPPTALQALISVILYYLTLATSGLLLVIALFTVRHRTLHDLLSGLVVVRVRAMEALTKPAGVWNMGGHP
jgi:uncharacterized RDD family membrane protein YckC